MDRTIDHEIEVLNCFDVSCVIPANVWAAFTKIVNVSFLPEQTYGEDRPAQESDFVHYKKQVSRGLRALHNFAYKFIAVQSKQEFNRGSLVWILALCGEHSSGELWTSQESCDLATSTVQALCTIHGCYSISQLLLGFSDKMKTPCFKQVLLLLRPKLLRETWRKHPGAVLSYKWLLFQVCSPHLAEYLEVVFPTALLIIDDHNDARKLTGLHCLLHITENVARTDMCQRGLDKVFYKALEPLLWQRKANQIEPAVACLTKLLSLTERGYTRRTDLGMWDLFDDTIKTLLEKMKLEDQIPLRVAYVKSLRPLLSETGPPVIRWSKPLLEVLDEYLCKESYDTRKPALEALEVFINFSGTRLSQNGDTIIYALLRTLADFSYEVETLQQPLDANVLQILKNCISTVAKACPYQFKKLLRQLVAVQKQNAIFNNVVFECTRPN